MIFLPPCHSESVEFTRPRRISQAQTHPTPGIAALPLMAPQGQQIRSKRVRQEKPFPCRLPLPCRLLRSPFLPYSLTTYCLSPRRPTAPADCSLPRIGLIFPAKTDTLNLCAMDDSLRIKYVKTRSAWRDVADAARTTIRLEEGHKEPSSAWKRRMLLAEHSPIRQMIFRWKWINLKYWVSVHFARHKIGIEHYVSTQRSDRTGLDRDQAIQASRVDHECCANAQAMIAISRKRLCRQASPETTAAWNLVLDAIRETEPELRSVCVPECVYRGFCPEFKSCGYATSSDYRKAVAAYRADTEALL